MSWVNTITNFFFFFVLPQLEKKKTTFQPKKIVFLGTKITYTGIIPYLPKSRHLVFYLELQKLGEIVQDREVRMVNPSKRNDVAVSKIIIRIGGGLLRPTIAKLLQQHLRFSLCAICTIALD